MNRTLCFFAIFLTWLKATAWAQMPNHTRVLYQDPLLSDGEKGIGKMTNKDGLFLAGQGWKSTGKFSQLRIDFADYLPFEGTVEFKVKNFYPPGQLTENSVSPFSIWSRPECAMGPLDTTIASFIYFKCEKKLTTNNTSALLFRVHPIYHDDNLNAPYSYRQSRNTAYLVWDAGKEYTFRIVWNPREAWLVVNGQAVAYRNLMNTDYWKENFAHLCLGNSTWDGMIGPIYRDLRILVPETSLPFVDGALSAGLKIDRLLYAQGAHAADVNGDGREDLYITYSKAENAQRSNRLFIRQPDSTFAEVTVAAGLTESGDWGPALFFDCDQDGDVDLLQSSRTRAPRLYINTAGRFIDESARRGPQSACRDTKAILPVDVDQDGDMDLLFIDGTQSHEIHLNDGVGTFSLAQQTLNMTSGAVQGAIAGDFTGDGLTDVFISNRDAACAFFVNQGAGQFVNQAAQRGLAIVSRANYPTCADLDNDGDLDLIWGIRGATENKSPQARIFYNDGSGHFTDGTTLANVCLDSYAFYPGDFDNDGWVDLYGLRFDRELEDGPVSCIFLNKKNGIFSEVKDNGADHIFIDGRGAVVADWDDDGRLDILGIAKGKIEPCGKQPYGRSTLLCNRSQNGNHFLKLQVHNGVGQSIGLGYKIWLYAAGHLNNSQHLLGYREINAIQGYQSQTMLTQHFGTGAHHAVDIRVQNPKGAEQTFSQIPVDQLFVIQPQTAFMPAYSMEILAGADQTGPVDTVLPDSIIIRVVNRDGQPVDKHEVEFTVVAGGGSLDSNKVIIKRMTDREGTTAVSWRLGSRSGAGLNQLSVGSYNEIGELLVNAPLLVIANAHAGPALTCRKKGDGQQQIRGAELFDPIELYLYDAYANPTPGVEIEFQTQPGQGQVTPARATTDDSGKVSVRWQLGGEAGLQHLHAVIRDYGGEPVSFHAVALRHLPQGMTMISGDRQIGLINTALADSFIVQLTGADSSTLHQIPINFLLRTDSTAAPVLSSTVYTNHSGRAAFLFVAQESVGAFAMLAVTEGVADTVVFHFYIQHEPWIYLADLTPAMVPRPNDSVQVVVKATDALGYPVTNQILHFTVLTGNGSIKDSTVAVTDAGGLCRKTWHLGSASEQRLFVHAPDVKSVSSNPFTEGLTIDFTVVNHPPVLTLPQPVSCRVGEKITASISGTDADGDSLRFFARNLPVHAHFDSTGSQELFWIPDSTSAGKSFIIQFIVQDSFLAADTSSWQIVVKPLNQPPVIRSLTPVDTVLTVNYDSMVYFAVIATDADADTLTYSWSVNDTLVGNRPTLEHRFSNPNQTGVMTVQVAITDSLHAVYHRWLVQVNPVAVYGPVVVESILPTQVTLAQNYPNPFNPVTFLSFELPKTQIIALQVMNLSGQAVRLLAAGSYAAGQHQVTWDGRDDQGRLVASGLYFYVLRAGDVVLMKKLLLQK